MDNLALRRSFIRKIVVETAIPEQLVAKIIAHQFNGVVEATKTCDSVEISGFGKFVFNRKKAVKKLAKVNSQIKKHIEMMEREGISPRRKHSLELRLETYRKNRDILISKNVENEY